jgi:hypothetical protein
VLTLSARGTSIAGLTLDALRAGGTLLAGRPHRADGTVETGQSLRAGRPDFTLEALETPLALDALSAARTSLALSSGFTLDALSAGGTGKTGFTLRSGFALDAIRAGSTRHTRVAFGARDTNDALSALRPSEALRAAQALGVRLEADVQVEERLALLAVLAETDEPERAVAVVATADRADRAADTDARRRVADLAGSGRGAHGQEADCAEHEQREDTCLAGH